MQCFGKSNSDSDTKSVACGVAFEKHLMFGEIASLSDQLRNQAAGDWGHPLELTQKVTPALLMLHQSSAICLWHVKIVKAAWLLLIAC